VNPNVLESLRETHELELQIPLARVSSLISPEMPVEIEADTIPE